MKKHIIYSLITAAVAFSAEAMQSGNFSDDEGWENPSTSGTAHNIIENVEHIDKENLEKEIFNQLNDRFLYFKEQESDNVAIILTMQEEWNNRAFSITDVQANQSRPYKFEEIKKNHWLSGEDINQILKTFVSGKMDLGLFNDLTGKEL